MFTKNVKSDKVSKHNQNRRGIVNLNVTVVKKSSGLSSKAIERKIEWEYKNNFHFFPAQ